jgi:hypothetical protein
LIIKGDGATVMPMTQLAEFKYITDFTGMAVRTDNSEFSERKGDIARRKLRKKNNTGEIDIIKE